MRRIMFVGVACAALVTALLLGVSAPASADGAPSIAFGVFPGNTKASSVQTMETQAGRSLAYVRVYRSWNSTFPDVNVRWMQSTGHALLLSIKTRLTNGTNLSWQAIADAQPGDPLYLDMVRWADAVKAYGLPVYLVFNHEPDTANSQRSGTAPQFVAAWQKFFSVVAAEGVTNAYRTWVTAVRSYSLSPTNARYAPNYYPGDAWVDDIAIDAYNMYCRTKKGTFANPWRSLQTLLSPFMAFTAGHPGPGLVLAEFGSPEDPADPMRKAQWISDAQQLFQQPGYERFVAASYWNTLSHNYVGCDFRVTSSPQALAAWQAMANDPYFAGSVPMP
jgi:hypothetical protein